MPFRIERNDITKVKADAIVNSANPMPVVGSGTDHAIYEAAGREQLLADREKIGPIKPGDAVYTPAYGLDARYIIHTVGPVWDGGDKDELEILGACYRHSLLLADYLGCKSIAFPMISTGVYGFPKDLALKVAIEEISDFLMLSEMEVTLVVFDKSSFDLSKSLLDGVRQYIDDNYVDEQINREFGGGNSSMLQEALPDEASDEEEDSDEMAPLASLEEDIDLLSEEEFDAYFHNLYEESIAPDASSDYSAPYRKSATFGSLPRSEAPGKSYSLDDAIKNLGMTFQQKLLSLIDDRGLSDTQVYKNANIDRKLFSKIRCNVNYKPSKATVLALAISLELNIDETVDLLKRAGLALQPSSKADLIVRYCIDNKIYDIYEVNAILFEYDQQLLGA
ncbi:MAG: macro domain-containing protein [Mogibacterium sp.]|nr:macro domain-containing protein [Mogibacterium sp.]